MVNQEVDGNTKTNNPRNAENNNLLKIKRILKPKYKVSGGPVFTFSLPGGNSPFCPQSLNVSGYDILYLHTVSCPYSTATRYELVA